MKYWVPSISLALEGDDITHHFSKPEDQGFDLDFEGFQSPWW